MSEQNMEIAGEFLEMAARLVYIKTVSLLPQKEEAEHLKKDLQGRLEPSKGGTGNKLNTASPRLSIVAYQKTSARAFT